MKKNNKILVFRFSSLGDVAISIPVLKAVVEQNEKEITVVSKKEYYPLFKNLKGINFVGIDFSGDYRGIKGLLRAASLLKNIEYTAIADLHNVLRTKILRVLLKKINIPVSVLKKGRRDRKKLTRQKNKTLSPLLPMTERYAKVFRRLGMTVDLDHLKQNHPIHEKKESSFAKAGVGIAPFAAYTNKVYPLDRMKKVVLELAHSGEKIVLFGGGEDEKEVLESWVKEHENIESAVGKYSIEEELLIMQNLKLMVCMDSANMHLASLVGTRVISVWGGTHPYAGFLGHGQSFLDCVQKDNLSCRPCSVYGKNTCIKSNYECLDIPHTELLKVIKNALI